MDGGWEGRAFTVVVGSFPGTVPGTTHFIDAFQVAVPGSVVFAVTCPGTVQNVRRAFFNFKTPILKSVAF